MTAESSKIAKYSSLLPTHEVVPVVVETLGTWGEAAWKRAANIESSHISHLLYLFLAVLFAIGWRYAIQLQGIVRSARKS